MTEEERNAMMQQMLQQQAQAQAAARAAQAAAATPAPDAGQPAAERTPLVAGFDETDPNTWGNPGRNDPCPCGSGEKFKHCHGRLA